MKSLKKLLSKIIGRIQLAKYLFLNFCIFKRKKIKVGKNNKYYGKIKVYGNKGKITIGNNCIFRSGLATNPLGGMDKIIIFVGLNGKIKIGNNVGISNSCLHIDSTLIVEDYVNIGGDVKIYDSNMHSVEYEKRISAFDNDKIVKPITIKKGAWIGAHSIILKGVTIGERSVIGAGSVVTKNIPNDEVWAGNPAVFIKKINNGVKNEK